MVLLPGSRLGSHRLVARVGRDGCGELWRARDDRSGITVAVQILRSPPAALAAAASLRHPNLRALYAVGTESGVHFLVLETLVGETLAESLARASLPIGRVLEIAQGVASGLAALHRAGIVHGNLDPEKVLLADGGPKLVDFGLGRTLRSFVPAVPRGGPPHSRDLPPNFGYLSPEEIGGEAATFRSDVFSFGTILDEMLAGPVSIEGPDSPVARALRSIVGRSLARDPALRFSNGAELLAAVDEVLAHAMRLESSARETSRASRRRIVAGWAIAGGIVAAAVVDAFRSPPETPARSATALPAYSPPRVANSDLPEAPDPMPERGAVPGPGGAHGAGE